jgi:hypothetical protein
MLIETGMITIIQGLKTRHLEAYYGLNFLWATPQTEPGSCDEVAEFYTMTLIRLIDVLKGLSAHERMQFLARSQGCEARLDRDGVDGLLGTYLNAK